MKKFDQPRGRPMPERRRGPARPQAAAMMPDEPWIWGQHSLEACLDCAPENILEVFIEKNAGPQAKVLHQKLEGFRVSLVERLPRFLAEKRTQGVAAKIKEFPVYGIEKFYDRAGEEEGQVVILDRIQDVQNFGAILRSAAALGSKHIIIGSREQAPVNGSVAQISAGNIFRLGIYVCHQLPKTCERLAEAGYMLLALETGGEDLRASLDAHRSSKIAWILGAEEDGIQPAILKRATRKIGIPMVSGVESLNVSNSAAIALYEGRQHLKK